VSYFKVPSKHSPGGTQYSHWYVRVEIVSLVSRLPRALTFHNQTCCLCFLGARNRIFKEYLEECCY